ncbi:family 78 glycoside hydrolase catalytic domain [Tessaracoccus sp. G1721]
MTVTLTPPRFEHHDGALGIGNPRPRLSWIVETAPTGWSQAAYEIEERDGAAVRVESADSVLVPWPFGDLGSRERREVRVRVTGSDGETSGWGGWAAVEAGLLHGDDWTAAMVGPSDDAIAAPLLRRGFDVPTAGVARARLYASAHGVFQLELNGRRVGEDEFAPGWTTYQSRLRYVTYDVTDLVQPGRNALGAWLGDGWWRGHLGWDGRRALYGEQLGLIAQLEIEYTDGTRQVVATDDAWVGAPGPITSSDLYDGESFDARLLDPAWSTASCDASGWAPVVVRDLDTSILVAPDGPPVRCVERLAVAEVLTSPSGATILDFGQNLVGRLRIRVAGEAGTVVTLRHAEVLERGELATGPLRGAKATDTYTLAGHGVEEWAPRFTFHGFRYAEITGWPGAFDPADVVAEVIHSDMARIGRFDTSHPLVAQLHHNVVWGMKGNFLDVPTDCPQRDERLGWTGDLQVFAPTATFLHHAAGFLTSWLKDLAAEQRLLGGTPMVVPAVTTGYSGPMAGWADAATVVPWTLYRSYGDVHVLEEQFDSMTAWVDEVAAAAGADRVWSSGFQFGDWLDPTAPAGRPEQAQTYPEIVATAYFARSARIVADAAALLGRDADAERYGALADEVSRAFEAEYVSPSGRLLSDSATAYALALQFDLIRDHTARRRAADKLAEVVRGNGYKIATGFIGTPLVCDALSANGHADAAYRLLLQTENPSWLYSVKAGATTIWERWDSLLPDGTVNPSGMTSFNHYAFGAVADWLHRVVAGLAAAEPGYRRIRVAPQPPRRGLDSASASLATPYGEAAVAWRIVDDRLTLTVTVPVGATAEVDLPSGTRHEVGHGEHTFAEPFETDKDVRREVSVDTRMGDLIDDADAMAVFMGVITKYVPEAAEHMTGGLRGQDDVTPRQVAGMLPHSDQVLADMAAGFAAVSAGEPVPAALVTAPAVDDGELRAKAALLTGRDFWTTKESDCLRSLTLSDGPHGVRLQRAESDHLGINDSLPATCFPPGAALGSSWDPDLVREVGRAIGEEARDLGVDVVLGPGVNIKRSPLGGRSFEYLSEDPHLSGELGLAWVEGVQSTGVGASVKHFAANNQETDRMRVDARIDARTLRELYLPAFERIVTAGSPATVMSAYNAINGEFCSENRWLLTELLRDEWGFDGLVVSDWGAIKDRAVALEAGLDLEMPSSGEAGTDALVAAVREGRLSEAVVDRAVGRLIALAERTAPGEQCAADLDAHHALARRAAAASVVLLRNEADALPLREGERVAVVGRFAEDPQFQGGGSSRVNATRVDTPLDALRAELGHGNVAYAAGYAADDTTTDALIAEARSVAQGSDVAVVVVGLGEAAQSEGFDREHLDLPEAHVTLIRAVAEVAARTVVVLMNGGVVSLEPWHDDVDAIVESWVLGQAVGSGLADVLTGRVNPSGRLAETIPLALGDTPSFHTFPGENEVVLYGERMFVGYRHYTTSGRGVRYPFGHGLSYTTFERGILAVEVTGADTALVTLSVLNTGQVPGADVVQVYVSPADAHVARPVRELRAFAKVHLEPGEQRQVTLELGRRAFAYWDVTREDWRVEGGRYLVQLGSSAQDIVDAVGLELDGDTDTAPPLTVQSTVKQWFGHPVVGPLLLDGMLQGASAEQREEAERGMEMLKMVDSMPMEQFARMPMVGIPDEALEQLVALSQAGGY